ncbi:MAG: hypothetical protein FWC67_02560, partial [Defluviitaleaceae bacterium]|nr:hypothetical protein [Defluviitaleaceae bacterium]
MAEDNNMAVSKKIGRYIGLLIINYHYLVLVLISGFMVRSSLGFTRMIGGLDSPVYAYVGWTMTSGARPYLDVWIDKGPLFYLIQWLAMAISVDWGLFAVRFVFMAVFAVYVYKIGLQICQKNKNIALLASAWTVLSLSIFEFGSSGSNHIENFALPFVAIGIYYVIKIIQADKYSWTWPVIIGACASACFLMRANFFVPIVAFCAVVFIARIFDKRAKESFLMLAWFFAGFILVIIPIALWLMWHGALLVAIESSYTMYFVDPGWARRLELFPIFFMMLLPGLVAPLNIGFLLFVLVQTIRKKITEQKERLVLLGFCAAFILTLFAQMLTGDAFEHYLISLAPLYIFPAVYLFRWILGKVTAKKAAKKKHGYMIIVAIAAFVLIFFPLASRFYQNINDTLQFEGFRAPYVDLILEYTDENDLVQLVGSSWVSSIFI